MAESVQRREKASFHDTYQIAGVWRFLTAAAGDTDTVSLSGTVPEPVEILLVPLLHISIVAESSVDILGRENIP